MALGLGGGFGPVDGGLDELVELEDLGGGADAAGLFERRPGRFGVAGVEAFAGLGEKLLEVGVFDALIDTVRACVTEARENGAAGFYDRLASQEL